MQTDFLKEVSRVAIIKIVMIVVSAILIKQSVYTEASRFKDM
jgi:hypothetical protein